MDGYGWMTLELWWLCYFLFCLTSEVLFFCFVCILFKINSSSRDSRYLYFYSKKKKNKTSHRERERVWRELRFSLFGDCFVRSSIFKKYKKTWNHEKHHQEMKRYLLFCYCYGYSYLFIYFFFWRVCLFMKVVTLI